MSPRKSRVTRWVQINQGYDTCVDDVRRKVELDLEYIDGRSPAKNLLIMAKTMPMMVLRKGAK